MEFKEILERYEQDIAYANRMLEPECLSFFKKSADFWQGYKKSAYGWFQFMKIECGFIPETLKISKEESQNYIYIDEFNNYYYPDKWLVYRGEKIPVYYDDYGQQEFIVYKGKGFYSGAYNLDALHDFCSFVDHMKDNID